MNKALPSIQIMPILALLLGLLFCHSSAANTIQTVTVDPNTPVNLFPYLQYAIGTGHTTAKDLQENRVHLPFRKLETQNLPAIGEPVWLRVRLHNPDKQPVHLILNFEELLFDEVQVYYRSVYAPRSEAFHEMVSGLNYPYSERPINYRFFAFPIDIGGEDEIDLYLRITSHHIPLLSPSLTSISEFMGAGATSRLFGVLSVGAIIGICLVLVVFMPLVIASKEAYSFVYYIIATSAVVVSIAGFLAPLMPNHPQLHKYLFVSLLSAASIGNLLMVNLFFEIYKRRPVLNMFYWAFAVVFLAQIIFYQWLGGYESLILVVIGATLGMYILLFTTSVLGIKTHGAAAWLFLLGISFFFTTTTYASLGAAGMVPYDPWVRHTFSIGLIFQALIYCLATGVKVYQERNEKTELQRQVEIARAENRGKSEFLATMSHEIRTPVNGVLGMAQMLKTTQLDQRQRHYADVILSSGKTLLAVINDILDFSKIEANKMQLENRRFYLPALIEQVRALFALQAKSKGLGFQVTISGNQHGYFHGDITRIQQVLNNLLSNAFKFTARGGISLDVKVSTVVNVDTAQLIFTVKDTGIGIDKQQQAKLFTAFTQADHSTTRNFGGTGLGLAISKRLVEMMHGRIGFSSEPDEGSSFWFSIPLTMAKAPTDTNRPEGDITDTGYSERRIKAHLASLNANVLVVEDNPVNQQVIVAMLQNLNVRCDVANDGFEALRLYRTAPDQYQCVLMDCEMPGKDGYVTTREIREFQQETGCKRVPVIALTAHVMSDSIEKCYAYGMDKVITKPIQINQLARTLAIFLSPADLDIE